MSNRSMLARCTRYPTQTESRLGLEHVLSNRSMLTRRIRDPNITPINVSNDSLHALIFQASSKQPTDQTANHPNQPPKNKPRIFKIISLSLTQEFAGIHKKFLTQTRFKEFLNRVTDNMGGGNGVWVCVRRNMLVLRPELQSGGVMLPPAH